MPELEEGKEGKEEQVNSTLLPPPHKVTGLSSCFLSAHPSWFFCRYNPENLATLERYVETQAKENAYDLEANLAVLKL